MCLCYQAVSFGTGQEVVMPCSWEGNRRSGIALAMRHRLQWFIHCTCGLTAYGKEMSTPPTLLMRYGQCRVGAIDAAALGPFKK